MNDLPVGRSVDETLRLVQAFQYTDRHGEVCPAGWKPGQDTVCIFQISLLEFPDFCNASRALQTKTSFEASQLRVKKVQKII